MFFPICLALNWRNRYCDTAIRVVFLVFSFTDDDGFDKDVLPVLRTMLSVSPIDVSFDEVTVVQDMGIVVSRRSLLFVILLLLLLLPTNDDGITTAAIFFFDCDVFLQVDKNNNRRSTNNDGVVVGLVIDDVITDDDADAATTQSGLFIIFLGIGFVITRAVAALVVTFDFFLFVFLFDILADDRLSSFVVDDDAGGGDASRRGRAGYVDIVLFLPVLLLLVLLRAFSLAVPLLLLPLLLVSLKHTSL
jgi:hypothetical protein